MGGRAWIVDTGCLGRKAIETQRSSRQESPALPRLAPGSPGPSDRGSKLLPWSQGTPARRGGGSKKACWPLAPTNPVRIPQAPGLPQSGPGSRPRRTTRGPL